MIKVKQCRYGQMMYLSNDKYIGEGLEKYGESHFFEVNLLKQFVSKGDTVIDVGANIGVITIPLAQSVGKEGRVIAIEAQPFIFNILCGNLALNELECVQPLNRAAADASGTVAFIPEIDYRSNNSFGSYFVSKQPDVNFRRGISTLALDDMDLNPRLIKIDVEGLELPVLNGSIKTIKRCKPILFVEFLGDYQEILEFMKSIDYDFRLHEPPLYNSNNYLKDKEDIFVGETGNPIVSIDIVCWHKDTSLQATSPFLYDVNNSPFERHQCLKELRAKIYEPTRVATV